MRYFIFITSLLLLIACQKDETTALQEDILADYIELNNDRELADLIACAGGLEGGLFGEVNTPTSVFFYPIEGATDFRYFEADMVADSMGFSKYKAKELTDDPIFNGYLWKFNNLPFTGEKMGVVTFKTPGKLHVCTPIRQKINTKPTEVNENLAVVEENGITPAFKWEDGLIKETVIYFQVISDMEGNLISGTYTFDKNFTFYDLSNVVLNITDSTSLPVLEPNSNYKFSLMGVSEDNWVNLFLQKEFSTN